MKTSAFAERLIAGRWIAGPGIGDAVRAAAIINNKGLEAELNYLGEDFSDPVDVSKTVKVYESLLTRIAAEKLKASIALKPTQLGMGISEEIARENYSKIVKAARKAGIFVWLDMESHDYVDRTISLYETEVLRGGVGICIQSYLRRSAEDLKRLVRKRAVIRLVKGAYKEDSSIAFVSREERTKNYERLMRYLFSNSKRFMIATHDERLLDGAVLLSKNHHTELSFGMLKGIRNGYAEKLSKKGMNVVIYVPFGEMWLQYSYRRLREASNMFLVLRSLFER